MDLQVYDCILYTSSIEESLIHLFLHCPFIVHCQAWLNIQVDQDLDPFQAFQSFKEQLSVTFFMEVITLMCWAIWKSRNDFIFRQINPLVQNAKENFRREFELMLLRAKKSYSPQINQWIANLVQLGSFFLLGVFSSVPSLFPELYPSFSFLYLQM